MCRTLTHSGPIDHISNRHSGLWRFYRIPPGPKSPQESCFIPTILHQQFCIVIGHPPFERTLLLLINAGMSLNVGSFSLFLLPYAFDPYTFRSNFRSNDKTTINIYTKWYCVYLNESRLYGLRIVIDNYYPAAVIEDTDKEKTITYDRRLSTMRYDWRKKSLRPAKNTVFIYIFLFFKILKEQIDNKYHSVRPDNRIRGTFCVGDNFREQNTPKAFVVINAGVHNGSTSLYLYGRAQSSLRLKKFNKRRRKRKKRVFSF